MTAWFDDNLSDARALLEAGRFHEAVQVLLIVLSVYPDSPEALRLTASVVYLALRGDHRGKLTDTALGDTRLDPIFCACESENCFANWISWGQTVFYDKYTRITNARGVRCTECSSYFCRDHYTMQDGGTSFRCPNCGGEADPAPRTANGRPSVQTGRLNHPLIHIYVVREGPGRADPEFMNGILKAVAPEVFDHDEDAGITGMSAYPWPEDPIRTTMSRIGLHSEDHLSDRYTRYCFPGTETVDGKNWLIVKIYANTPKYIDSDAAG